MEKNMSTSFNPFAGIEIPPSEGWVMNAVNKKDITAVKKAISKAKNNVDYTTKDNTPLMISIGHKNFEIAELLIKNGADINHKNRTGATLAHLSAKHGAINILGIIAQQKPSMFNEQNLRGETSLFSALRHKNLETFNFIINQEPQPDVNTINTSGQTLLDIIDDKNNDEITNEQFQSFRKSLLSNGGLIAKDLEGHIPTVKENKQKLKTETEKKPVNTTKKDNKNVISGVSSIIKKKKPT